MGELLNWLKSKIRRKKEASVLICASAKTSRIEDMVPGTVVKFCVYCGGQVFVAPGGQRLLAAEKNVVISCLPCGTKAIAAEVERKGKVDVVPADPEEMAEAFRVTKP